MAIDTSNIDNPEEAAPYFKRPTLVCGPRLKFRPAQVDDAEFILSLRLDEEKNAYLSKTSASLEQQRNWLANMDNEQLYFIIEAAGPVGTVRLYDQKDYSFCWGSWILNDDAPKSSAVESTLMVYRVGLELGFNAAHFDVRKGNEKVWRYHERLGAIRIDESEEDFFYSMPFEAIHTMFERYSDRLTKPISITW